MKTRTLVMIGAIGIAIAIVASVQISQSLQTASAETAAEIHYAPEENLERVDERLIGEARKTVDVAAYVLTDAIVAEALAAAAGRGARVRIWQDGDMADRVGDADIAKRLGDDVAGLEIRYKPNATPLMHLKGFCVDGRMLRTGSANFSRSGERDQDNDLVVIRSAAACAAFEAKFARLWDMR